MAGDWIKMRTDLYRDPKVSVIADILMQPDSELATQINQIKQRNMTVTRNVMRNATVGALVSVWGVFRSRGKKDGDDLYVNGCTLSVIDDVAEVAGFGLAMCQAGWVKETSKGIVFYNFFEEYNTEPNALAKSKNAERQRRYRERKRNENSNATHNVTVTQQSNIEERRGEESNTPLPPGGESVNQEIVIQAYRDVLVSAGRPNIVDSLFTGSTTERNLKARWKQSKKHQTAQFWETFFTVVTKNEFWMGEGNWKGVDLHWLMKKDNFGKVIQLWVELREKQNAK